MTFVTRTFRLCWIGLCALAMLAQTRAVMQLPLAPGWLDGYVFGSTVFAYGFTHPDRRHSGVAWLAGAAGGLCFAAPFARSEAVETWQYAALIPLFLWLCYYGLQRPGRAGLRSVPLAKPVVVSLTWAAVTVLMPLPPERWKEAAFVLTGRALFIFALALAYDLSDIAYDRRHGLATLAGNLGARKTFRLTDGAFAVAALCYLANGFLGIFPAGITTVLLCSLLFSAWWLRYVLRQNTGSDLQKMLIDALMPGQFLLVAASMLIRQGLY